MTAGPSSAGLRPVPTVPAGGGTALRVTLVSPRPVPESLVAHVADLLAARAGEVASTHGTLGPLRTVGWALRLPSPVGREGGSSSSLVESAGQDDVHDDERPAGGPSSFARTALALRDEIRGPATALGVDVAVTTGDLAEEGPGLVLTDVDSTLFANEVIELVAAHAGVEAEVAAVTERAMRGELDFRESLDARVALIAGLEAEPVLEAVRGAVELSPGAADMFLRARDAGVPTGVVSGGFVEVVGPLVEDLGVRFVAANRFEIDDGRLTGRTIGDVVDRTAKATHARAWTAEAGVPMSRLLAVGDGANDLDLLGAAGLGVGYGSRPVVRENADAFISSDRLDTALALTGVADPIA
ncbi:phosphoserine phosphatase SerB [Georgenia sp. Z1344]|uniref:phosphoserine phosphatase SerB n=1 Tax=Georgenia sp. Z1344 TaxID=3416706 RepID=UPI003CF0013D